MALRPNSDVAPDRAPEPRMPNRFDIITCSHCGKRIDMRNYSFQQAATLPCPHCGEGWSGGVKEGR